MNSSFDSTLQTLPAIVYLVAGLILLVLALSWLFLPWTINGHLKKMVKIQQLQLDELEAIARNTRPPGSAGPAKSDITYRMP